MAGRKHGRNQWVEALEVDFGWMAFVTGMLMLLAGLYFVQGHLIAAGAALMSVAVIVAFVRGFL
jgi:hypothetical protein